MTLVDFINSVNGLPYTEERHCWALAAEIQSRFFGRNLPLAEFVRSPSQRHAIIHSHPERDRWVQAVRPDHGALVLMSSRSVNRVDHHAGVCILMPHPVIVHTDKPHGIVVDDEMILGSRGWHPSYWVPA